MAERRVINGYIVERQDDGSLVTIGPAGGTAPQMPADPTFQYEGPQASATLTKTQLDNKVTEATLPYALRKAAADAAAAEAAAAKAGQAGPESETQLKAGATAGDLRTMMQTINELQTLYNQNLAGQGPLQSVGEYFPSNANDRINTLSAGLGQLGMSAFRVPGSGEQSDRELANFIDANQPSTWNRDSGFIGKLDNLRRRAENRLRELGQPAPEWVLPTDQLQEQPQANNDMAVAGSVPPQDGGPRNPPMVGGLPKGSEIQFNFAKPEGGFDRNAWLQANFGITPNQEAGIMAFMKANRGNPRFSYNDLAAFYKGIGAPPPVEQPELIDQIRKGNVEVTGYSSKMAEDLYNTKLAARTQELDTTGGAADTIGRTAANALFGAGDRLSAGIDTLTGDGSYSENLARQRFESDAAREANPLAAFTGDVLGLTGGTIGSGRAAQGLATRIAPSLARQGAAGSSFARNVANDAAYGAAYGATEQGDPITGGLTSAAGSAGGQALGKAFGSVVGGISDPAVRLLADNNVPMTVGSMLGNKGMIGRTVNKFESFPAVGDALYGRRMAGNEAVLKGELNNAVAPAGATIRGNGVDGLAEAQGARSQAFTDAYSGINAPVDMQYLQEVAPYIRTGRNLPGDFGRDFSYAVESDLRPLFGNNRTLTGDTAQQMRQDLSGYASDFGSKGKLGTKGADQFRGMQSATENLIERTNPGAVGKINAANQVNARLTPIENAMITANGNIPSPLQLRRAVTSNTKLFGGKAAAARGDKVSDFLEAASQILPPTIPNSGSADRLGAMILPAALGGSTVGLGALTDPEYATPLAIATMLSTKTGQAALQKAIAARKPWMRKTGGMFGNRNAKRLSAASGIAVAPMLLPE